MIQVRVSGSFKNMEQFAQRVKNQEQFKALAKFGPRGVAALSAATPKESSETAQSWTYEIVQRSGYYAIHWYNTHMAGPAPVAIMLQYGHGTGTGGYVEGRDYINPAMRPIFDEMVQEMWRVVTR